jgi:hypothetical protein
MSGQFPARRPADGFHSLQPQSPRALEVFEQVPPGCEIFLMRDNALCPHLRQGEFAVIDMNDREYQFGELYLIQWSSGHRSVRQVKKRWYFADHKKKIEAEGVWFLAMVSPTFLSNGEIDPRGPLYLSDGPLKPQYLPDYLMGRVIGIFEGPDEYKKWPVPSHRGPKYPGGDQ